MEIISGYHKKHISSFLKKKLAMHLSVAPIFVERLPPCVVCTPFIVLWPNLAKCVERSYFRKSKCLFAAEGSPRNDADNQCYLLPHLSSTKKDILSTYCCILKACQVSEQDIWVFPQGNERKQGQGQAHQKGNGFLIDSEGFEFSRQRFSGSDRN